MDLRNDRDAVLALSRFGLGATSTGIDPIKSDPRNAVKQEIVARVVPVPKGIALKPTEALLADLYQFADARKAARQTKPQTSDPTANATQQPVPAAALAMNPAAPAPTVAPAEKAPNPVRDIFLTEVDARFNGTIHEPLIGFGERLVQFWANHFAISAAKGQPDRILAGAYEREAIRPHVFGRFADMLLAAETHPAMLIFLDNQQSIGPDSRAGRNRHRGLNENLAREIMELHTLGVDGGYTQADVTAFARAITGWTVAGRQGKLGTPGSFIFNANAHEPGEETILGARFAEAGIDQGKAVLSTLARHPATAKHIAFKLARHFVADVPPPSLVKTLADTFRRTDGDLAEVSLALISADEAWTADRVKVRTPAEFMIAMLRATDARPQPARIAGALTTMGQPIWAPPGPNGFADTADAWASPEGLGIRMDIAAIAAREAGLTVDARQFLTGSFGPMLTDRTREAVARAETREQGLALAFLSPEFQRR